MLKYLRENFHRIFRLAGSALVFIIALEVCARLDDYVKYQAPLWGEYSHELLHTWDSDDIRCNIPNGSFEKWENNRFGFRGPDFDSTKPEGVTRVVCMGTSETYGLHESPGKEWPAQLSSMLEPYGSFHVINASTVGSGFENYLKYMDKYVLKFKPDVVILLIGSHLYMQRLARSSKRNESPWVAQAIAARQRTTRGSAGISPGAIISHIRILPKIKQTIKSFLPESLVGKYQHWNLERQIARLKANQLKSEEPLDKIPPEFCNTFEKSLDSLISDLEARGVEVVLCTYPSLICQENLDSYPILFMGARRFMIDLSYSGMIDASHCADSIIQVVADKRGLGYVDCNGAIPKSDEYFGDVIHLRDTGAEIFASRLADYIIGRYGDDR